MLEFPERPLPDNETLSFLATFEGVDFDLSLSVDTDGSFLAERGFFRVKVPVDALISDPDRDALPETVGSFVVSLFSIASSALGELSSKPVAFAISAASTEIDCCGGSCVDFLTENKRSSADELFNE